jgi:plastocyanin
VTQTRRVIRQSAHGVLEKNRFEAQGGLAMNSPSKRVAVALGAAGGLLLTLSTGLTLAANGAVSIVEEQGQYKFSPANVTVQAGSKVVWSNNSDAPHTVTADDNAFDSGSFSENGTFEQTFNTPGEFGYYCTIHSYMHAKVTVVAANASQPPTDSAPPGTSGGTGLPWLPLLAAGGALVVFSLLGQRALVARKRP